MHISSTFNLNMQELTDVFYETRGNYQDYLFERNLSLAYEKIVYWKKIFFITIWARREEFHRLNFQTDEWIHESPLKDIAFKAIVVMPGLLLKKSSRKSKSEDHFKSLGNRMKLWHTGKIMGSLEEEEII